MSSRRSAPLRPRLLWSRWLVLALLSLVLPLQGALAATMGIDMALMSAPAALFSPADSAVPDCHGSSASPDSSSSMTPQGAHALPHDRSMDHDGAHHAASPQTGDGHGDSHGDGSAMDHSCGICLQCCIGAALPIAPLTPAAQRLRDVAPSLGASRVPDELPRSLDRPPKPRLA